MPTKYNSPTLVMNIERRYFAEILADPPTKRVEYRACSPYWLKRLEKVGKPPFNLRLLNGMLQPVPEATVQVTRVVRNRKNDELEFHIGSILEVKHWDRVLRQPRA